MKIWNIYVDSQFVDVDNDGFLDLYALAGYFTAPREVEIPVDT